MGEPGDQTSRSGTAQNDIRTDGQGRKQQGQPQQQGQSQQQGQPQQQEQPQQQGQSQREAGQTATTQGSKAVSWFTETFLRAGIALIGVVLLLVAVGQMAGVDTFSIIGSILSSNLAQWGAVAIFGILLVIAASKSWTFVSQ